MSDQLDAIDAYLEDEECDAWEDTEEDLSFWISWAERHSAALEVPAAGEVIVVRREWLVRPLTIEESLAWWGAWTLELPARRPDWVAQLRAQVGAALAGGGELWQWQFGDPDRESGAARGLAAVCGGRVLAEWWLQCGALPEFADRDWVRPNGSVRPVEAVATAGAERSKRE
jgi:hypothetical protein